MIGAICISGVALWTKQSEENNKLTPTEQIKEELTPPFTHEELITLLNNKEYDTIYDAFSKYEIEEIVSMYDSVDETCHSFFVEDYDENMDVECPAGVICDNYYICFFYSPKEADDRKTRILENEYQVDVIYRNDSDANRVFCIERDVNDTTEEVQQDQQEPEEKEESNYSGIYSGDGVTVDFTNCTFVIGDEIKNGTIRMENKSRFTSNKDNITRDCFEGYANGMLYDLTFTRVNDNTITFAAVQRQTGNVDGEYTLTKQ